MRHWLSVVIAIVIAAAVAEGEAAAILAAPRPRPPRWGCVHQSEGRRRPGADPTPTYEITTIVENLEVVDCVEL